MGIYQNSGRKLADELDDPDYRRMMRAERRRQKRAEEYAANHWRKTGAGWELEVGEMTVVEASEWDDLKS